MLTIQIPAGEIFNEKTNEFIDVKGYTLTLEHSLVSISKWESKWHKPFLGKEPKNNEEMLDYIKCMTLTQNINPEVYTYLTPTNLEEIANYIEAPMTATWFNESEQKKYSNEVITSEIIYYWMITFNIPVEFQKWHLNRLLTLIKVCGLKNAPKKKMSKSEVLNQNRAINKARRESMNSSG